MEEDRAATRLELFFDLAYVLVIHQLALALTDSMGWRGVGVFAGVFVVTWWSWVTTTLYANRFDTNDVIYRVLKPAATFAVAVLAAGAATAVAALGFTIAASVWWMYFDIGGPRPRSRSKRTTARWAAGGPTGTSTVTCRSPWVQLSWG
nr:low temperature requirement protein A [Gordonia sp. LAM0048]